MNVEDKKKEWAGHAGGRRVEEARRGKNRKRGGQDGLGCDEK